MDELMVSMCFDPRLIQAQGASPRELILEACRRNNTSLLEETIADLEAAAPKAGKKPTEYVAETLNKAFDGVGNGCLHLAATYGSCTYYISCEGGEECDVACVGTRIRWSKHSLQS